MCTHPGCAREYRKLMLHDQITEAIRRYGVADATKSLIVVRICSPDLDREDVKGQMQKVVEGTLVSLEELSNITDWASIKKVQNPQFNLSRPDVGCSTTS